MMSKYRFDAVIFDLDGVITKTALVHGTAWKEMFDDYLREREKKHGEPFKEFTHNKDYLPYVDGKPRYKGVASFLESRGIEIPYGDPDDDPEKETVCGLGNRKNKAFNIILERDGVEVYDSTVSFIKELKNAGIKVGVASSSKNCKPVLEAAGLVDLFETRVDGVVSAELDLSGKPEPDIFTTACDNLGITYDKAVIVEDAVSGVQAGMNGNFGMVLGIAREDNINELKANGADIVVTDIAELGGIEGVEKWFEEGLPEVGWSLNYYDYDTSKEKSREALLAVGNGYFGTRGAMEETESNENNYPGTYIAGLYNRLKSPVGDRMIENEDFVNNPNWLPLKFKIDDGDWLDVNNVEIERIHRQLDFRTGVMSRDMIVKDKKGRRTQVISARVASMDNPHIASMEYKVTPLNYSGNITFEAGLNGDMINDGVERYSDLEQHHLRPFQEGADEENHLIYLEVETVQSAIRIAEACKIQVSVNKMPVTLAPVILKKPGAVYATYKKEILENQQFCLQKLVAIHTSKDSDGNKPLEKALNSATIYSHFDEIVNKSTVIWNQLWDEIDIQLEGDRKSQMLLRLHLYHLMVTTSVNNKNIDFGIPARGLHGEAYRGHIFWDELYALPVYYWHLPEVARSVLMYRYRRIDKARKYAKEHGYEGAMFPWQSGSSGREETQVVHLNPVSGEWGDDYSSLQRHINIAVAYNIWQYYRTTGDLRFMEEYGAEIFLEICRFWASKTTYNDKTGKYEIKKVMGPDEFHEKYPDADEGGLKDNAYTNIMVSWLFMRAFDLVNEMNHTARIRVLDKINLKEAELKNWKDKVDHMNLVISPEGIIAHFDGYFDLKELDWDAYEKKYDDIHRMDRILKAEGKSPDAYKVSKQADLLMVFYLLDIDTVTGIINKMGYKVPDDYVKKNFYYYLKRTSHGSTLSRVVHAFLANLIGEKEFSWELYSEALASDYTDIQGGTTGEGIHAGVMGGTIMIALSAYAGINLHAENIRLSPNLPESWKKMSFNFRFRQNYYIFEMTKNTVTVTFNSKKDRKTDIYINNKKYTLEPERVYSYNY